MQNRILSKGYCKHVATYLQCRRTKGWGSGFRPKKIKCLKMKVKFSNVTGVCASLPPVKGVFFSFLSWNKETCSNH